MSLDAAIRRLDAIAKHWTITTENSRGVRRYECTVWTYGKRFTTNRATPLAAINAVFDRLAGKDKKGLKLVGAKP